MEVDGARRAFEAVGRAKDRVEQARFDLLFRGFFQLQQPRSDGLNVLPGFGLEGGQQTFEKFRIGAGHSLRSGSCFSRSGFGDSHCLLISRLTSSMAISL